MFKRGKRKAFPAKAGKAFDRDLAQDQCAEAVGVVECVGTLHHGTPAQEVLGVGKLTALEEVTPEAIALLALEGGEEQTQEPEGNRIIGDPALFGAGDLGNDHGAFLTDQTDQVFAACAEAEVHCTVGVHLDVEVALITGDGG